MSALPLSSLHTVSPASRWRRFMSMLYESVLLFGVVFIAGYLFDTLTQSRHALWHRHERQAWLFFVIGVYFVWFWAHGGQTLAMKTWRVRLEDDRSGRPVVWHKALFRYVLAWPCVLTGMAYVWSWFDREAKFLHDRLLGTRLVEWRPDRSSSP